MTPLVPCSERAAWQAHRRAVARSGHRHRQRGSMLLEALVGMVLSAALGLGMAYSAARALSAQRYHSTQTMAVLAMRGMLAMPADLAAWCTSGAGSFELRLNNVNSAGGTAGAVVSTQSVPYTLACNTVTPTLTGAGQGVATSLQVPATLATTDDGSTASALFGGNGVVSFGR